ncbi:UDP-N-acetylglucosamine 1-carboxyvinyltransferase [Sedimentisphaera salicampi]|uniref:UDP-N-acetylglucosamine 1-carboxyvinyltransferase n=1 Tax=Sedimentisphaera salicampi TaxID=1941349 RepID=A0A1W6LPW7_9BACT|nr:UDP-N-acetylglucosamine 1-carboxyvinyltransferase [Sedimentisphaera salicampi]ARN57772.1 UDP-N-acetylglucosamine 1-carboxyvinyltransferase [Sedimentisphaera salicampi]OXU13938.1 UDP-N-acetylglucosamine 1-carboxyvinyltransferase [Sedimentisphaera salicampi]
MDVFKVHGGTSLSGKIRVSGSKNSALPLMSASLLASGTTTIKDVPVLSDVLFMQKLLGEIGAECSRNEPHTLSIDAARIYKPYGDYEIVRKMRASICVLGPLLARCGRAEVSMPGGCSIGTRPVDLHIRGLRELGADIRISKGYIIAKASKGLKGKKIFLGGPFGSSVLATANVMMAATLAEGETIIESAACEPEVVDLANFLKTMGARIYNAGSPEMRIEGVPELRPTNYRVIPDRIEAGTYMVAAGITGGELEIDNCRLDHLGAVSDALEKMGMVIEKTTEGCRISSGKVIRPVDITTQPYPGFPTDLQAQFMAMLSIAQGNSVVTEKIFPDRFMHVPEMTRMGALLRKEGQCTIVNGVPGLTSAPIMASDLRASAALVLAGLAAEGETTINRVYHIDRGYEKIEEKLNKVGAEIVRESA